uniref:G-protein coupled receptors family 1 profile domain-containing protein n=1 Tax=Photinus pyralis TaxID=7054 RepID=A0A1Y1KMV9_PHOPY
MEAEEFGNFSNLTFDATSSAHYFVQDMLFTMLCFVAILANVGIIYTTFHFRRMRTVPNIILANWAIADLSCLLTTPSNYRLIAILDNISLPGVFVCSLYEVGNSAAMATLFFAIFLSTDWCIAAFFESASKKFRKYTVHYLLVFWVCVLGVLCVGVVYCIHNYLSYLIQAIMILIAYCTLLLFVVTLQICNCVKKCRRRRVSYPKLMLNISTAFTISWFIGFVNLFIMAGANRFYRVVEMISSIFLYCTSIMIFIILYRQSNDFHACVNNILRRDRSGYEEANFDFHTPVRKPIVKNGANCLFSNRDQNVFIC